MTDRSDILARYRLPLRRDALKPAAAMAAPALRFARRNPMMLMGALLLGVAGAVAWRNRDRIAETAGPLIDDARSRGQALVEEARAKGHDLMDEARAATGALGEKAADLRRRATSKNLLSDIH
jgi:polyhydroxyalkanoate synthesis regulator phasin